MISDNLTLMREARKSIFPFWGLAVGVTLGYVILTTLPSQISKTYGGLINILVSPGLIVGFMVFVLNIARDKSPQFSDLFSGFNRHYGTALLAYVLLILIVIIGFVLFIVPGVIVSIGLSMTFYIIADDSEISAIDALKRSWKIMDGYKLKCFYLLLRFIPWFLLGIITLGVGLLFVVPWLCVTLGKFYNEIKQPQTES